MQSLSCRWQLPIFSGRLQPNIVGVCELNFCVRYGYKWVLTAIITTLVDHVFSTITSTYLPLIRISPFSKVR